MKPKPQTLHYAAPGRNPRRHEPPEWTVIKVSGLALLILIGLLAIFVVPALLSLMLS